MGPQTICAVITHYLSAIKIGSLANGIKATMFERGKGKSLKLRCFITRGTAETSIIIKDLKDEEVSPFNSPVWPLQKARGDHGE